MNLEEAWRIYNEDVLLGDANGKCIALMRIVGLLEAAQKEEIEPGMPIVKVTCPCCGASLEIMNGDDPGEIAVFGVEKKSWEKPNEYGELPGDICCQRATGEFCYEHNPANYGGKR